MLLDYSDEEQKKLRPFFTSDHIYCLFDAFSQDLHNVARNGSPRYAGLLRQIASKTAKLQDIDQLLFWRTFSGGVFHRRISVNSEPEKTDVWRFSSQFDFPHINENGELSRTVLMFEGLLKATLKISPIIPANVLLTVVMPPRWMRMLKTVTPEFEVSERLA